jgi:hypothetical protein
MSEVLVTTIEIVNPEFTPLEKERLELLDFSLSLLIDRTNFGFDELLKQYNQAVRLYCTETQGKIEKIMLKHYAKSWKHEMGSDYSSADGKEV